jgi:dephospho-CoA kinase
MKNRRIRVVGLTGQTGAGKSTVSQALRTSGIPVIDADQVSREVVDRDTGCIAELALAFSTCILNADGTLNRRRLADLVFGDREKLERLNRIIFAYIIEEIDRRVAEMDAEGRRLVVLDAPTLFESGADASCDMVVSVIAPEGQRLSRIMLRDRLTEEQAEKRIASQHPDEFYTGRSRHVIVNDGGLAELQNKAAALAQTLLAQTAPSGPTEDISRKG